MNQYTFKSNTRTVLFVFMALGILCLGITFFVSDEYHTRFWSNILINVMFFTGISFMTLFLYAVHTVGLSGFHTTFKRIWEAFQSFIYIGMGLIVFIAIGNYLGFHHLYLWASEVVLEHDEILQGKSAFLNPTFYLLATILIGGGWAFMAWRIRRLSVAEDEEGTSRFGFHRKIHVWSAILLPLIGFGSSVTIWLWVMSVDSHWYSTLFAWYTAASWTVAAFTLTILVMIWLKTRGYYSGKITVEHLHDMGKYVFAFSIFWAYLWFAQFMLIWYGNIGEEVIYYKLRATHYPVLFYGNFILNFVLPFFVFLRNDTKRKYGTLIFTSIFVFFGHWIDTFLMISPGVLHTANEIKGLKESTMGGHGGEDVIHHISSFVPGFTLPGLLEIGIFLGFLSLFLYVTLNTLSKAALVPPRDPYLGESLHHHV